MASCGVFFHTLCFQASQEGKDLVLQNQSNFLNRTAHCKCITNLQFFLLSHTQKIMNKIIFERQQKKQEPLKYFGQRFQGLFVFLLYCENLITQIHFSVVFFTKFLSYSQVVLAISYLFKILTPLSFLYCLPGTMVNFYIYSQWKSHPARPILCM